MSNVNTQNKRQDDPWWGTKHSEQSQQYKDYDDYASPADSSFYAYIDKLNIPRDSEIANTLKAMMLAGKMPFIDAGKETTRAHYKPGTYFDKLIRPTQSPEKLGPTESWLHENLLGSQFGTHISFPFLADPNLLKNEEILKERPDSLKVPEPWNDKSYREEKPFDSVLAEVSHAIDIANTPQYMRLMHHVKGAIEGLLFGASTYDIHGTEENIAHSSTQPFLEGILAKSFSEHMPDYRTSSGDLPVRTWRYNTEGGELTEGQRLNLHPETREALLTPGEMLKHDDESLLDYVNPFD